MNHNAHVKRYYDQLYIIAVERNLQLAQFFYYTHLMREIDSAWSPYQTVPVSMVVH